MGVLFKIDLQHGLTLAILHLFHPAGGCHGRGPSEIGDLVGSVVHEHGHPRIGRQVGKLPGGPGRGKEKVIEIFVGGEGHQAGIGLSLTLGGQNALFLIAQLLAGPEVTLGLENPGYVDARSIFELNGATVKPIPVDGEGIVVGAAMAGCDCVFVTPSHQSPGCR